MQLMRFNSDLPLTSTDCAGVYSVWDLKTRRISTILTTMKMLGRPPAATALFTAVTMPTAM